MIRQSAEELHGDDLCRLGILLFQTLQDFVDQKDAVILRGFGQVDLANVDPVRAAAAFLSGFLPRTVHQDASHDLRGGTKKVRPVIPTAMVGARETNPCFMDQRGRLEGVPGILLAHVGRSQAPQFVVNQWQQVFRRKVATCCRGFENSGDVARHGRRDSGFLAIR